jgi:uncharacterized protein (DUF433 family)
MNMKKDLVTEEEIEKCLRYNSDNSNNRSAQEGLLNLLREIQISLDEHQTEDSIDGTRIQFSYTLAIRRKRGGTYESAIRFHYIKEIPIDYGNVPLRLSDSGTSAVDDAISSSNNGSTEDTIIESYDEIEKGIPTLYEVLGLLKRIYFMPEDFSNRLVVDRIHKLRKMFSKDEILTLPSIDLNYKAGLVPL